VTVEANNLVALFKVLSLFRVGNIFAVDLAEKSGEPQRKLILVSLEANFSYPKSSKIHFGEKILWPI